MKQVKKMQLVLGIDGGGTKTEAVALGTDGNMLLRLTGDSTNPHAVTFPKAMRNLCSLLDALASAPELRGYEWTTVAMGLSGVGTEEEQQAVHRCLEQYKTEKAMNFDASLQNDAQIALMATLRREEGIIAISGTGSIVYGLTPASEHYRIGGWGHLLGDEGSGYDIGLRTLKAVMRSYDGIEPPTRLTGLVLETYGLNAVTELKPYIYKDSIQKSDIARFAELCIRAAEDGDAVASAIVRQAAEELSVAVLTLIGKNAWFAACDLVMTGSIFSHSPLFSRVFRDAVTAAYPGVALHAASRTPAYGAALLALKRLRGRSDGGVGLADTVTMKNEGSSKESTDMNNLLDELTTEQVNPRSRNVDMLSTEEIIRVINEEDRQIADKIQALAPQIAKAADCILHSFQNGGRLLYIGAGTSGRLGILDASECPPTYGTDPSMVQGVIAGGDRAIKDPVEGAEDSEETGAADIDGLNVGKADTVVGIAASGRTPYVLGAMKRARELGATVVGLCNNNGTPMRHYADHMIEAVVGPEVVLGSTRMKAGTAQKLILNMLTTTSMIRMGKVYDNLMVDLNPSNAKLVHRAKRIIRLATDASDAAIEHAYEQAEGHVKTAIVMLLADADRLKADQLLSHSNGFVREAIKLADASRGN